MNADDLRAKITSLSQWKRAGEQAPHKPLLLLLTLAAAHNDHRRWIHYTAVEPELQKLLEEFGPPRRSAHANYPNWRLQGDGVWTLREADGFTRNGAGDVSAGQLRQADAQAGFTDEVHHTLFDRLCFAGLSSSSPGSFSTGTGVQPQKHTMWTRSAIQALHTTWAAM